MADGRIGMSSEERKKKKGHQRRVSEATTLTMTSTRSAGASPQRFQLQQLQQQQHSYPPLPGTGSLLQHTIPEKQPAPRSMMGNLFGMVSKRRSFPSVEEEDPKRRFGYGGQQYEVTGLVSQRNSMIILDDGDEDLDDMEEDSDLDEDEHATAATATGDEGGRMTPVGGRVRKERRRQVLVNDYGFICELEDCKNNVDISNINIIGSGGEGQHGDGQGLGGQGPAELPTGSMVSELAARLSEPGSFLAEHERRRNLKKQQEFNRASEVKWIQAISHLQPDQVKKLTKEDLHSILKAYAHYKPSVGYCQGMGRLVGMMLMQMPIEEAFWLLVATLESGYLNDYFTPTLRQLRIDALVFERLLKAQDPRLAHHLQTNDVSPIMYITPWFLTLFTMSLPWASVLRVWDVFYFDGVKTLFRIGLGILQICRTTLLEDCPSSAECMDFLLHVPLNRLGPEVLLDRTAFRIRLRRESLEKMSLLTAVEMDAKEARVKVAASAKAGSRSVGENPQPQQQQQQQQEEDEEKKKSDKQSMMGSLKGEKAAATATTPFTTTIITTITTTSTPPTSATSIRTTKSHATTSSRSDNVVTFAEPPTTTHTSATTTTITTMGFASAMATSAMNQETPLADLDHDRTNSNNTNTTTNNPNTDFTQINDNDTHHNEEDGDDDNAAATTTEQAPTVENAGPPGEGNKREKAEEEEGEEGEEEGYSPPQQPLLIATSDISNHIISKNNGNFGTASRPTSQSSMRTTSTSLSPTSPCLPPPPPPHSPSSSNIITPLPPIPPTTSVCPNNNNSSSINGLSGFSPLGVFRTRKRAGTHV
ncbi:hypothetical protein BGX24_011631 [Mortierella sp. AD032]|nr:hypothetical protein BGX24_011631 [Mortierella sp. AD032]